MNLKNSQPSRKWRMQASLSSGMIQGHTVRTWKN
jgi:hypothetical protein